MPGLPETFALLDESENRADATLSALHNAEQAIIAAATSASEEMNRLLLCRGENFTSITLDQAISAISLAEIDADRLREQLDEVRFNIEASKRLIQVYRNLLRR